MTRSNRFILAALVSIAFIASQAMGGTEPSPFNVKKKYNNIILTSLPVLDNGEVDPVALVIESSIVSEEDVMAPLSDKQKAEFLEIVERLKESQDFSGIEKDWKKFVKRLDKSFGVMDVSEAAYLVMMMSARDLTDDLIFLAQQVNHYNSVKNEIRELRDRLQYRIDYCLSLEGENCLGSIEDLGAELARWDDQFLAIGDDAQQLQFELQQAAQEYTQQLQTISNIIKQLHDTATDVIQNIK